MRDRPKVFDGDVPWCRIEDIDGTDLHGSKSGLAVSEATIREMNLKVVPTGTVIASCSASLGSYAIASQPLITNQTFIGLVCGESLFNRFLLHVLSIKTDEIRAASSTGTIAYVSRRKFEELVIPVPPLEVQHEIVRILDQFTQLEAELELELEAELEARRCQFMHYRHLLLAAGPETSRVPLGTVVEVRSGWGFPKAEQGEVEGVYPFYKVSDMNLAGNEFQMTSANNFVSEAVARKLRVKPAPAGTVIFPKIGAAVATNKKRVLTVASAYDNNVMGLVPGPQIESGYLYHWMQTFDLSSLANDSGAVPSIRKSEAERLEVPLPPLEEQHRIAARLDRFRLLVHGISDGLPGEKRARLKQYEYYRDQLLTFEELGA